MRRGSQWWWSRVSNLPNDETPVRANRRRRLEFFSGGLSLKQTRWQFEMFWLVEFNLDLVFGLQRVPSCILTFGVLDMPRQLIWRDLTLRVFSDYNSFSFSFLISFSLKIHSNFIFYPKNPKIISKILFYFSSSDFYFFTFYFTNFLFFMNFLFSPLF
jgi:hypothetical protein